MAPGRVAEAALDGKKLRSKNIVAFENFYVKLAMSISRQGLSHN